jgi:hypothetical protein
VVGCLSITAALWLLWMTSKPLLPEWTENYSVS